MTYISVCTDTTGLHNVRYRPTHIYQPGEFSCRIPAQVTVQFKGGDIRLDLAIEDAEALMYALASALVEHAVALKNSPTDGPKLVA